MNVQCKCGETDIEKFYKYRLYECKVCFIKRTAKGSNKPSKCKCGETDPNKFYKRGVTKCKACVKLHASSVYKESMKDDTKRTAKNLYNKNHQKNNIFRYRVAAAKRRASDRQLQFNIDEAYLIKLYNLQEGKCFYSGIPFDIENKHFTWSIERIDSSLGYIKGNVALVTNILNTMKNELPLNDFLQICRTVVAYQKF